MEESTKDVDQKIEDTPKKTNLWLYVIFISVVSIILNFNGMWQREQTNPGSMAGTIIGTIIVWYIIFWCLNWVLDRLLKRFIK